MNTKLSAIPVSCLQIDVSSKHFAYLIISLLLLTTDPQSSLLLQDVLDGVVRLLGLVVKVKEQGRARARKDSRDPTGLVADAP